MPKISWIFPAVLIAALGLLQTGSRSPAEPDGAAVFLSSSEALPSTGARGPTRLGSPSSARGQGGAPSRTDLGETTVDLIFPQVADGQLGGGQYFRTVFLLHGLGRGTLEFFDSAGDPLELTIDGVTAHAFPLQSRTGPTIRVATSGTGDADGNLAVGWARIRSEQMLSGAAMYEVRDAAGKLRNSVGVAPGERGDSFTLFADVRGQTRTGLALVNPTSEPLRVDLRLRDRSGTPVGSPERVDLLPLGHHASYLDEIFKTYFDEYFENPGIRDFEGSVVAGAAERFTGITLRATGFQLTSMPMVRPPGADADWRKFAFPHLADGAGAGLRITTDIVLFNNTDGAASGQIDLFTSDGGAMEVTVEGARRSSIPFSLGRDEVRRLSTAGVGELRTGWARVEADRPIVGTALFTIRGADGSLLTEVGVGAAPLMQGWFDILVDAQGEANTGIALAWAPSAPGQRDLDLRADLYRFDENLGYTDLAGMAFFSLPPLGHRARFLHELFPEAFPDAEGIDFVGRLQIVNPGYLTALCLRQEGILLTSLPLPSRRHLFLPAAQMRAPQNLAGTSPPIRWNLRFRSGDLQAEEMVVFASGVSLNEGIVREGERFGYGVFAREGSTQVFELFGAGGSGEFVLIQSSAEFTGVVGGGELVEIPGRGVEIRTRFEEALPFTTAAMNTEMDLVLQPGLLVLPAQPGDYDFEYQFRSVAARPEGDERIVVKRSQRVSIAAPHGSLANLTEVRPAFPARGDLAYLEGTNFGESPRVIFPASSGEVSEAAFRDSEDRWAVVIPFDAAAGPIRVDNGAGPGNPYEAAYVFGPSFRLIPGTSIPPDPDSDLGGSETGFRLEWDTTAGMFAVAEFGAALHGVEFDPASLVPGTRVGRGNDPWRSTVEIRVISANSESALLGVYASGADPFATIALERDAEPPTGLLLEFKRAEPAEAPWVGFSEWGYQWWWNFEGLKVTLPEAGEAVGATILFRSSPTGFGGAPALESVATDLFVTR